MPSPYDVDGPGAEPDDLLVRRGRFWESAYRMARKAAEAEQKGTARNKLAVGFGLSFTSPEANRVLANDPTDAVAVTRRSLADAGFEVRYTPTNHDADHHTVIIPQPVTKQVEVLFNTLLGRRRGRVP